jgi:beta-glucanase (GH16 family)
VTTYTFQDEFDRPPGAPPDPGWWTCDLGGGGWGNNELQSYPDSPANVFQDGQSNLVIRATRQVTPGAGGSPPDVSYHSARITTLGKFAQSGGSFEARIKVNSQRGLWPAFWLMGQDIPVRGWPGWPGCGEVDVLRRDFCPPSAWVYDPQAPHNGGMFLLLNLAVGGNAGPPPDSVRFPVDLLVDYVRVRAEPGG